MALPKLEQVDVNGTMLEKQFVVNHLGHYLLTRLLLPNLEAARDPRIVMVSSMGYTLAPEGGVLFDNLSWDDGYQPFKAYGMSKLSNILMSNELNRRYFDAGISSNAIHPGLVGTNLTEKWHAEYVDFSPLTGPLYVRRGVYGYLEYRVK